MKDEFIWIQTGHIGRVHLADTYSVHVYILNIFLTKLQLNSLHLIIIAIFLSIRLFCCYSKELRCHTHTHTHRRAHKKQTSPLTTAHSLRRVNETNTRNTQQTVTSSHSCSVLPPHLLLLSPHRSSRLPGSGLICPLALLFRFFPPILKGENEKKHVGTA